MIMAGTAACGPFAALVLAERLPARVVFPLPGDASCPGRQSSSSEVWQKFRVIRSMTFAQAATVPGVGPSDLQHLELDPERLQLRHPGVSEKR